MNHQPYREWLLSDQQLTKEQVKSLQDHLMSCEECCQIESSWMELEEMMHDIPSVGPASGFTGRWQAHLIDYHIQQQKRRSWITIAATTMVIIAMFAFLIQQVWSLFQSPELYLAVLFDRMVGIISIYYSILNITNTFSWPAPLITFLGMFFLFGVISFMSVLWLATYRKFSLIRRRA